LFTGFCFILFSNVIGIGIIRLIVRGKIRVVGGVRRRVRRGVEGVGRTKWVIGAEGVEFGVRWVLIDRSVELAICLTFI
jgi:hypothetical protein